MRFSHNNFDLIRLLAAFQVLLIHGLTHFGIGTQSSLARIVAAFPGVPVFFIVSGFLVSASWQRSLDPTQYARNRALRIFPALWVCLALTVAILFPLHGVSMGAPEFLAWAFAQMSVAQFHNPEPLRTFATGVANGSLWTIPIELQFYLLLPALCWSARRLPRSMLMLLSVGVIAANFVFLGAARPDDSVVTRLAKITVLPYLYLFGLGVVLHLRFDLVRRYLAGRALHFALVYATVSWLAARAGWITTGNSIHPVVAFALSLFVLSFAYTAPDRLSGMLKGNDISYGIYIYHMVWTNALLTSTLSPWQGLCAMAVLATGSAWLSWRWVEKPALELKHYSARQIAT